jgi:hypothetical protein
MALQRRHRLAKLASRLRLAGVGAAQAVTIRQVRAENLTSFPFHAMVDAVSYAEFPLRPNIAAGTGIP